MHFVLRALPLALALTPAVPELHGQPAELPPIFAPRAAEIFPAPAAKPFASRAPLSDRVREAMNGQILATAKAFEGPVPAPAASATPALTTGENGALLMQRFVVRSVVPRADEVRPPPVVLGRFAPVLRVDRQRHALTATLASFLDGAATVEFSVVNAAAFGADHNIDFTRVELGFKFRF